MSKNELNEEDILWRKPKPMPEWSEPDEDGVRYSTMDLTPHPYLLMRLVDFRAKDLPESIRDEAVRFHQILTHCNISVDWAKKLARRTHILHVDEESNETHYVLTLHEVKEEEE
jgi:hypothetical protein